MFRACETLGISVRTYERWRKEGKSTNDKRYGAIRKKPGFALSDAERQQVLDVCHQNEYSSLPPGQIVPALADMGIYLASESTFYRVLREHKENQRRGRAKASVRRHPLSHLASAPLDIWVTDISWLRGPVVGVFFYLYFVMDLFSRKIVGYEVYENEASRHLATVVHRATMSEGGKAPNLLHSDNGSPMKGVSLLELCRALEIVTSYSRPRVSDDNPHIESLFRTTKYWPGYPYGGFAALDEAREWVERFVSYYNNHHRHSGLNFVTPVQMHNGDHIEILKKRDELYENARSQNPARWSRQVTRNWSPTPGTWTTPPRDKTISLSPIEKAG